MSERTDEDAAPQSQRLRGFSIAGRLVAEGRKEALGHSTELSEHSASVLKLVLISKRGSRVQQGAIALFFVLSPDLEAFKSEATFCCHQRFQCWTKMGKRPSQGSPASQRSSKKQKLSPPSPPHTPSFSTQDVSTSQSSTSQGTGVSSMFGIASSSSNSFGVLASSSPFGPSPVVQSRNGANGSQEWTKVEKRKDKKQKNRVQKALVSISGSITRSGGPRP